MARTDPSPAAAAAASPSASRFAMPNPFDVLAVDHPGSSSPRTTPADSTDHSSTPDSRELTPHLPQSALPPPPAPCLSAPSRTDSSSSQASCSEKDEAPTPPRCSTPHLWPHSSFGHDKVPVTDHVPPSPSAAIQSSTDRPITTSVQPAAGKEAATEGRVEVPADESPDEDVRAVGPPKGATSPPAPVAPSAADADKEAENKAFWKKVYQRTIFTFAMIGGFVALLLLGHPYMILLVTLLATMVYKEIVTLFNKLPSQQSASLNHDHEARKEAMWNKTLSWYMFSIFNYYLYGESLVYYLKHIVYDETVYFVPFARSHRFLSLMLYVFGFMAFILHLRRDNLQTQFSLFAWVHMTIFLIVVCSHFMVNSILEGLIWFWVPASLIICNDCFAYVCGMVWGRTPLISLSPKKTREGFLGAFVITVIFGYFWGSLFQQFDYMVCPAGTLGENVWSNLTCERNPVFHWQYFVLPDSVAAVLTALLSPLTGGTAVTRVPYTPFQLHTMVMASFASLVGPFGGFFASGFKRAYGVKDFGDSIPGHGGLTDRFDCQFLMGLWAYTYYTALIRDHHASVQSVLQMATTELRTDQLVELYHDVGHYLAAAGQHAASTAVPVS